MRSYSGKGVKMVSLNILCHVVDLSAVLVSDDGALRRQEKEQEGVMRD